MRVPSLLAPQMVPRGCPLNEPTHDPRPNLSRHLSLECFEQESQLTSSAVRAEQLGHTVPRPGSRAHLNSAQDPVLRPTVRRQRESGIGMMLPMSFQPPLRRMHSQSLNGAPSLLQHRSSLDVVLRTPSLQFGQSAIASNLATGLSHLLAEDPPILGTPMLPQGVVFCPSPPLNTCQKVVHAAPAAAFDHP